MYKQSNNIRKLLSLFCGLLVLCLFSCKKANSELVDHYNDLSYTFHYKDIDSTLYYSQKALSAAANYSAGKAESYNNRAFVELMKMEYEKAYNTLDTVYTLTDNQLELLVADVQMMRLCQRQSKNKDFYDFQYQAQGRLKRIQEEKNTLSKRLKKRLIYAETEFYLITSTYYFYIGLDKPSIKAMKNIDPEGDIQSDKGQYLAYLYNIGAGGFYTNGSKEEINEAEFDNLIQCYMIATKIGLPYWQANALQGLSNHLQQKSIRNYLMKQNLPAIKYINSENMPDSLLAGNLAQRSLELFTKFGDVYQIAGSYRTLATCYWQIHDYNAAINCLQNALKTNKAIYQAPDLIASIREQLSVSYSAVNAKQLSDFNRNIYLDLQEQTRQDRYYEARAGQLEKTSHELNILIISIVLLIIVILSLIIFFHKLKRSNDKYSSLDALLLPLKKWQEQDLRKMEQLEEDYEEAIEQLNINKLHVADNKRKNLEQRTKISLVNSITPFIDRMLHEIDVLKNKKEDRVIQQERFTYINELTEKINEYNNVLTEWIQLRQGKLSLHIESFPLATVFDIVRKGKTGFKIKGLELLVNPTTSVVKADRVLTLFMINTLADNARKFTEVGGKITIAAKEFENFVEISVSDTGVGIPKEEQAHIFDRNLQANKKIKESHGFGLMNCKGIINKYKKVSQIFSVCDLGVESEVGKGSIFYFRLPKGISRILLPLCILIGTLFYSLPTHAQRDATPDKTIALQKKDYIALAIVYADSAYYCNVNGLYNKTLLFADTCRYYLNKHYKKLYPNGRLFMQRNSTSSTEVAEIIWFQHKVPTSYNVILDIRNESAVAALALHQWGLYRYNNAIYTRLFKEKYADSTLSTYCKMMLKSESNKNVAVILLILGLLLIFPAYYFLYYRHRLFYRYCIDKVNSINEILLSLDSSESKLQKICEIRTDKFPYQLKEIVGQIKGALENSISKTNKRNIDLEILKDDVRCEELESEKLHISNSILDNCLSTLKHETMYYPSRIQQLVSEDKSELQTISELAQYYKELYSILSVQAMVQVNNVKMKANTLNVKEIVGRFGKLIDTNNQPNVMGDLDLLKLMFEILYKKNNSSVLTIKIDQSSKQYIIIHVIMDQLSLSKDECKELFSPNTKGLDYFICRQIVRENGEVNNKRGCGISATSENDRVVIHITLSRQETRKSIA